MNGHSVAEYQFGDQWVLLDGDQNVFLCARRRGIRSEADLLADPFLVLRNRIYGLRANWSAAHAWQNTSRFEFVNPGPQKRFRVKGDGAPTQWAFFPGETITFYPDRIPRAMMRQKRWAIRERNAGPARLADFTVDLAARRRAAVPRSPLPILSGSLSIRGRRENLRPARRWSRIWRSTSRTGNPGRTLICQVSAAFIPTLLIEGEQLVVAAAAVRSGSI